MSRFSLCLVLALGHPALARGHDLPDGEIERRVQVSVKPDCVLVQYSLTMNGATLKKVLHQHRQKPAETLPAMWKQYQKIVLPSLHKRLCLTVEGERAPLKPIRADFSGWGHPRLTCLLKAEVVLTHQLQTIVVADSNFLDVPGSYRLAMKGRSGVKMEKSTVPALASRAKPVVLSKLTKFQKEAAARAEGEFVLEQAR